MIVTIGIGDIIGLVLLAIIVLGVLALALFFRLADKFGRKDE